METKTVDLKLNRTLAESLPTYAAGLLEALATAKITADPVEVLEESDRWPRLAAIEPAEWIIGWFHGVAEALGVTVELVWAEAVRKMAPAPAQKRPRRGKAA